MNVLDSSAWIEILKDGPFADQLQTIAENVHQLLVPALVLHEVVRYALRNHGRRVADEIALSMQRSLVVPVTASLAQQSAILGVRHNLPLADSIVYATAQAHSAILYTLDQDFEKLPKVKFLKRRS